MIKRILKRTVVAIVGILVLLYVGMLIGNSGQYEHMNTQDIDTDRHGTVAIFGATGTIGDGLLKAALNDPNVEKIYVVTRRPSPRIEEGVASGKVEMTIHKDYLDYSAIRDDFANVDVVYWAIGLSSVGMEREPYREIHRDYPVQFVTEWQSVSTKDAISFHYVSGGSTSANSRMMWAQEKARAENDLKELAEGTNLKVVSYRPAFVLPTEAEVNVGHKLLHAFAAPIGYSVAAESIGHAMLEVSARGNQFENGAILENREIVGLGKAYASRMDVDSVLTGSD